MFLVFLVGNVNNIRLISSKAKTQRNPKTSKTKTPSIPHLQSKTHTHLPTYGSISHPPEGGSFFWFPFRSSSSEKRQPRCLHKKNMQLKKQSTKNSKAFKIIEYPPKVTSQNSKPSKPPKNTPSNTTPQPPPPEKKKQTPSHLQRKRLYPHALPPLLRALFHLGLFRLRLERQKRRRLLRLVVVRLRKEICRINTFGRLAGAEVVVLLLGSWQK